MMLLICNCQVVVGKLLNCAWSLGMTFKSCGMSCWRRKTCWWHNDRCFMHKIFAFLVLSEFPRYNSYLVAPCCMSLFLKAGSSCFFFFFFLINFMSSDFILKSRDHRYIFIYQSLAHSGCSSWESALVIALSHLGKNHYEWWSLSMRKNWWKWIIPVNR